MDSGTICDDVDQHKSIDLLLRAVEVSSVKTAVEKYPPDVASTNAYHGQCDTQIHANLPEEAQEVQLENVTVELDSLSDKTDDPLSCIGLNEDVVSEVAGYTEDGFIQNQEGLDTNMHGGVVVVEENQHSQSGQYSGNSAATILGMNPLLWSEDNVYIWMLLVAQLFHLDKSKIKNLHINGRELAMISKQEFLERLPHGDILWAHLEYLKLQHGGEYASETTKNKSRGHSKRYSSSTKPGSVSKPKRAKQEQTKLVLDTLNAITQEKRNNMLQEKMWSASTDLYTENTKKKSPLCKPKPAVRNKSATYFLWQFMLALLQDPITCPRFIRWIDVTLGVFKLVDTKSVSFLWGRLKNKPDMSYDTVGRALRYYYQKGIMRKVDGSRLVYQFRFLPNVLRLVPEDVDQSPEPVDLSRVTKWSEHEEELVRHLLVDFIIPPLSQGAPELLDYIVVPSKAVNHTQNISSKRSEFSQSIVTGLQPIANSANLRPRNQWYKVELSPNQGQTVLAAVPPQQVVLCQGSGGAIGMLEGSKVITHNGLMTNVTPPQVQVQTSTASHLCHISLTDSNNSKSTVKLDEDGTRRVQSKSIWVPGTCIMRDIDWTEDIKEKNAASYLLLQASKKAEEEAKSHSVQVEVLTSTPEPSSTEAIHAIKAPEGTAKQSSQAATIYPTYSKILKPTIPADQIRQTILSTQVMDINKLQTQQQQTQTIPIKAPLKVAKTIKLSNGSFLKLHLHEKESQAVLNVRHQKEARSSVQTLIREPARSVSALHKLLENPNSLTQLPVPQANAMHSSNTQVQSSLSSSSSLEKTQPQLVAVPSCSSEDSNHETDLSASVKTLPTSLVNKLMSSDSVVTLPLSTTRSGKHILTLPVSSLEGEVASEKDSTKSISYQVTMSNDQIILTLDNEIENPETW